MLLRDRRDAGRQLAQLLAEEMPNLGPHPIVLALPRGGVPVGFEVARRLSAPLDVFVVRKIGVPGHEELAMGAIASGDVIVLNRDLIATIGVPDEEVHARIEIERRELARRQRLYGVGVPAVRGRGAILVDDGLATGATMLAGIRALHTLDPARITVAVPVASRDTCRELAAEVDLIVCAETPEPFWGVGAWYEDFSQTSDEEVRHLLQAARGEAPPAELS